MSSARSPPMHRSIVRCRVRRRGNLGRTPAPPPRGRGPAARRGALPRRSRPCSRHAVTPPCCAHSSGMRVSPVSTAAAALELSGVVGVLTGADVVAMSRPFPGRCREPDPVPRRRGRGRTVRRRAPGRRRRTRSLLGRGRARARSRSTTSRSTRSSIRSSQPRRRASSPPTAASSTATRTPPSTRAHLVVSGALRFPALERHPGRVLRRGRRLERGHRDADGLGELPGALHAPRRRGRRARPAGREAPADHAARLGRQLRRQGVGLRLRRAHGARVEQARRPRSLDRGPARAPGRRAQAATARSTDVEAAFAADGELLALRYDAVEDVGAYVRAPEPATLYRMHGSLSGAYRVRNVAARNRVVLTNRCPTGLNRGFGGPQLYLALERTMAIAARRLGIDPAELAGAISSAPTELPYRTPTGALYDSGDYPACLDDVLQLARYGERRDEQSRARAEGRLVGIGLACVVEPSVSNMGYITLAADRPRSGPWACRSRATRTGASVHGRPPHGGVSVRIATTPQGQGHRTVAPRSSPTRSGSHPRTVEVLTDMDTATSAWTVASGALLVAVLGRVRRGRAARAADARGRQSAGASPPTCSSAPRRTSSSPAARPRVAGSADGLSLRRIAGVAHWNPESLPDGMEPGLQATAVLRGAEPRPARRGRPRRLLGRSTASSSTSPSSRSTGRPARCACSTTRPSTTRAGSSTRCSPTARCAAASRTAPARRSSSGRSTTRTGTCSPAASWTTSARRRRTSRRSRSAHRETPSPFTPLGAKGLGEGNTMSAPAALANAVADALGRDDVELPLTPPRVWALLQEQAP